MKTLLAPPILLAVIFSNDMTRAADVPSTDPGSLQIMVGSPPPADKIVRVADGKWRQAPDNRWAFSHTRDILPSVDVWRGEGPVAPLPRAERDLDSITYRDREGQTHRWADMLELTYTDGILVMHRGQVVYEKYFGALDAHRPHLAMSMTKSFTGTIAATLASQGKLDVSALVSTYIPELQDTAWGDATVQQVLDMTIGVEYSEGYADPKSGISAFLRAAGSLPVAGDYDGPRTLDDFLQTLKKQGAHGEAFDYKSVNAQVGVWIVERVMNDKMPEILSQALWQRLGVQEDAYYLVDSVGTTQGSGGLNLTLRDLARFGELMRNRGWANGHQLVPASVVLDIEKGGDRTKFAKAHEGWMENWSYHNFWWVSDWGAYCAIGINGQVLYIDPKSEMVIARFASQPKASDPHNNSLSLPAYRAAASYLTHGVSTPVFH